MKDRFSALVAERNWTFAKTYADTWPHDYVVCGKSISPTDFAEVLALLEQLGSFEEFYSSSTRYLRLGGLLYWVTAEGDPHEDPTAVLNRTFEELSYRDRRSSGTLPGQRDWGELRSGFVTVDEQGLTTWCRVPKLSPR